MAKRQESPKKKETTSKKENKKETKPESSHINFNNKEIKFRFWDEMWN